MNQINNDINDIFGQVDSILSSVESTYQLVVLVVVSEVLVTSVV